MSDVVPQIMREVEEYADWIRTDRPDHNQRGIEKAHARLLGTVQAAFAKTVIDDNQNVSYRRITATDSERCAGMALDGRIPAGQCEVAPMVAVYARSMVVGVPRIHHTHSLCALHFIRFVLGEAS